MNMQFVEKAASLSLLGGWLARIFLSMVLVLGFCPLSAWATEADAIDAISPDYALEDGPDINSSESLGSDDDQESEDRAEPNDEDKVANQTLATQNIELSPPSARISAPVLNASVHIQSLGNRSFGNIGQDTVAGTTGKSKRLEGIALSLSGIPGGMSGTIQYRAHVQNIGWQNWVNNGSFSGTSGKSLRLEAIQIKLTGALADNFDVYYRVHAQNFGWLDWTKNGEAAGTEGFGLRLEALQVCLLPKGSSSAPSVGGKAFRCVIVQAQGHSQNLGWRTNKYESVLSRISVGTIGQSKRLEAFNINSAQLKGMSYAAHVQGVGWQGYRSAGQASGTTGQSRRIEAVRFKLEGNLASQYDVYYRAHVSNIGWLDWAKNGEAAGTEGYAIRLEAIEVQLVKKGSAAPGATAVHVIDPSVTNAIKISCGYEIASNSWLSTSLGGVAGTTGQKKALTGIKLSINSSSVSGGINYRAHVSNVGWLSNVGNGTESSNKGNTVQAIQISLTGNLSKYFDVYYQSHVSGYGWMGWAKNGASSGSTGLGKNMEAYRVRVVPKGAAAPGSTADSFSDKNGFLAAKERYERIANGYSSGSPWMILVDLSAHKTVVLHGRKGSWSVSRNVSCVTGAPGSPTIRGRYTTTGFKRPSLSTDPRATYCTQISGGYFFHTILASNNELGRSLSHGCVRLSVNDARWIYSNIPRGTTVVLF